MAVITAAIFRSIFTVIESPADRTALAGRATRTRPGGKRGGAAGRVRGQLRLPPGHCGPEALVREPVP